MTAFSPGLGGSVDVVYFMIVPLGIQALFPAISVTQGLGCHDRESLFGSQEHIQRGWWVMRIRLAEHS
jgi:hypothetical protein